MAIEQDWWRNKLAEDIYATLRLKEQTLPAFQVKVLEYVCSRRKEVLRSFSTAKTFFFKYKRCFCAM